MRFRCEVNDDDVACFMRHYVQHSPAARKQVWNVRLYSSLIVFLFSGVIGFLNRDWHALVLGAFFFALMMVILKRCVIRSMIKNTLRLAKEGKGVLGEHEFELANGVFAERANGTETTTALASLHAVCETDSHVFVYTNPMMAHIIPKRAVTNEVVTSLLQMKEEAERVGPPPAPPPIPDDVPVAAAESEEHFVLGVKCFETGDFDGALVAFQRSLRDPELREESEAYLKRCLEQKGLCKMASDTLEAVLSRERAKK